mmetsp:Transcript_6402/g.39971  ORF Transcript_6402/g.39971 Transcript_6402/m.39971 type:complete len:158 (+) Transcript_6402:3152-3625(+)
MAVGGAIPTHPDCYRRNPIREERRTKPRRHRSTARNEGHKRPQTRDPDVETNPLQGVHQQTSKRPPKTIRSKAHLIEGNDKKKTSVKLAPKPPAKHAAGVQERGNTKAHETKETLRRNKVAIRKTKTPAVVRPRKRPKCGTAERQPRGRTSSQGRKE